jgi:protein tyrosine phosphatase (PTP) superfamily phosphohydrolase (DUF442 family)
VRTNHSKEASTNSNTFKTAIGFLATMIEKYTPLKLSKNTLADEGALLAELGLKYVHIPVDFKTPTDEDYRSFVVAMEDVYRPSWASR